MWVVAIGEADVDALVVLTLVVLDDRRAGRDSKQTNKLEALQPRRIRMAAAFTVCKLEMQVPCSSMYDTHERTMFGINLDLLFGRARISLMPTPKTFLFPELMH